MPINIDDTRTLLQAIERTNPPTTTLIDTFFPAVKTFLTNTVDMEYRKGGPQNGSVCSTGQQRRKYEPSRFADQVL